MQRLFFLVLLSVTLLVVWNGSALASPSNDNFAAAVNISALPFTGGGSTAGATSEVDEPSPCGGIATASVWFKYTPATNQTIEADTFTSNFDTVLSAYTGASLASLSLVDICNDAFAGLHSQLSFPV
ncbi:MAG: hypothetical protein IIA67_14525, partial [Planctomycetes bacterium]|nr:hypothetical protein [Planctomycetota bacterium]